MRACSARRLTVPDEPAFQLRLGRRDHAHPHHALRGPLGQRQRNQRAAEAENRGKYEQTAGTALRQMHAKHALDNEQHHAQERQDGQIGEDE